MDTTLQSKKPLPVVPITKNDLEKMYMGDIAMHLVRSGINEIIYDTRKSLPAYSKKTRKEIIATHMIRHCELKEFVESFGVPSGYYRQPNF